MFSGEKATKWETVEHCVDGLTTNGVLVMSPNGMFCPGHDPANGDRNNGGAPSPDQVHIESGTKYVKKRSETLLLSN